MAGISALVLVVLATYASGVQAGGELEIIYSPHSLKWVGQAKLPESFIKEVYSASMGLSVQSSNEWTGLKIMDPFGTPEAVVEVFIEGVPTLHGNDDSKKVRYPLVLDEYRPNTYKEVTQRLTERSWKTGSTFVYITLSNQNDLHQYAYIFGKITLLKPVKRTTDYLKPSKVHEDNFFLQELRVLEEITEKVAKGAIVSDLTWDFYELRFLSLHPLSDLHGSDSQQTKEAKALLTKALDELSAAFTKAYNGYVLVTAVSSDAAHTRRAARSILEASDSDSVTTAANAQEATAEAAPPPASGAMKQSKEDWNVAGTYDENYPVIFNILLWFGIVFTFTLIAIVYAIMDMDPGRDSIIYRMTSNRMKKDN